MIAVRIAVDLLDNEIMPFHRLSLLHNHPVFFTGYFIIAIDFMQTIR
jgi:hypothetical protein